MAIYKANGEEMNAAEINTVAGQLTDAYTDEAATSPASRSDLLSALAVARQANADELQVIIDADEGLSDAGVVASVDDIDEMAVVVTLPTDSGTPLFWAGQAALIESADGHRALACGIESDLGSPVVTHCEIGFAVLLLIISLCAIGIVMLTMLNQPTKAAERGYNRRDKRAK